MAMALLGSARKCYAKAKKSNCNAKKFIFAYLPKNTLYFMEVCIMIDKYSLGEAAQIATSSPY